MRFSTGFSASIRSIPTYWHLLSYLRQHAANVAETEAAFERARGLSKDNPAQGTRLIAALTLALPWTPAAQPLGLAPLPAVVIAWLTAIVVAYTACSEVTKRVFFRRSPLANQ